MCSSDLSVASCRSVTPPAAVGVLWQPRIKPAAMASSLLATAVHLGMWMSDPSAALDLSSAGLSCVSFPASCAADVQPRNSDAEHESSRHPEDPAARLVAMRHRLMTSSLRLAASHAAGVQNLQARFAFFTLRYAIAMNNYFRVRHANENCSSQVAAWSFALDAAAKAKINTYLREMPPDCPLR